jgi:hypothetical protein
MANTDNPRGFWPVRHLCGGEIRTNSYTLTTGATVYKGDVVKAVAAGTIEAAAADIGEAAIGIAAEYKADAASAGGISVQVYDDPWIVFGVQMDDAGTVSTSADVFNTANHLAGSGSSTTKLSGHELDMSDINTGAQFKLLGLVSDPNNSWGANCDVEVIFNEHLFKYPVSKV